MSAQVLYDQVLILFMLLSGLQACAAVCLLVMLYLMRINYRKTDKYPGYSLAAFLATAQLLLSGLVAYYIYALG